MACLHLRNSWKCAMCKAMYCNLSTLVSHIRASHSHVAGLSFQCGINKCEQTFHNTTTFYKHVRKNHADEYSAINKNGNAPFTPESSSSTVDGGEPMEFTVTSTEPITEPHCVPCHDEEESTSVATNKVDIEDVACGCLLKLRCKPGVTESLLNEVRESIETVVNGVLLNLKEDINELFKNSETNYSTADTAAVISLIDDASDPLASLSTTYRLKSVTQSKYPAVEPVRLEVGSHITVKDGFSTDAPDEIIYVPFLKNLESILQNDDIRAQVISGPHKLLCPHIGNVCDGKFFNEHPIFGEYPQALQIIAYFDEVELANPLGSKAKHNKIGAVYFTLANIDPAQRSRLDAINLVALFPCSLLNTYSIDVILEPFFDNVAKLSEPDGCTFTIKGNKQVFHGALLAFLGDTPAVCRVGGFKESVGFAERKCRHCMATDSQIQQKFTEDEFVLRTKRNHKLHCSRIEDPTSSKSERDHYSLCYGINRESKLALLEPFDITKQLPQDVMHVLLEGIAPIHLGLLLKNILVDNPVCSLQQFNNKIQAYPYQYHENAQKPSPITESALAKGDLAGKQTASQMRCLVHLFPLLMSNDLKVTHKEHLECFLQLHDLVAMLLTPMLVAEQIPYLKICIAEYLSTFLTLYNRNLTPKFHFLVHIPNQIKMMGPPVKLWCMRMEAKHKQFKKWAQNSSYKNPCLTLATRHQQYAAYALSSCRFSSSKAVIYTGTKKISPSDLSHSLKTELVVMLGTGMDENSLYRCLSIEIHGTEYRRGCWLMTGKSELNGIAHPTFGKVVDIFQHSSTPYLAVNIAVPTSTCYLGHLRSYEVTLTDQVKMIHPSSLLFYEPLSRIITGSSVIVKPRIDLYALLY